MTYPIWQIDPHDVLDDEQLGSKEKFWFLRAGKRWLFKESRLICAPHCFEPTGEDWAEKAVAEIARLISVRAARVELAEYKNRRGSASLNFISSGEHLEHGNEILAGRVVGYDKTKKLKQSNHTVQNIVKAIRSMFASEDDARIVLKRLAGYIVLDALVGNTDRHHENWGLLWHTVRIDEPIDDWDYPVMQRIYDVAPSFDHASSLGRELLDSTRERFLREKRIFKYVKKGKGGIYRHSWDKHGANPLEMVKFAYKLYPDSFRPTLIALESVPLADILAVLDRIPDNRISEIGRKFAKAVLTITYSALINVQRTL
jgi:hypothetical protein